MNKEELQKLIASHGYNVYFGAKKHFATYDIVEKLPRFIALLGVFIGVIQLWKPYLPYGEYISLLLVFGGIYAYTITQYDGEKEKYEQVGKELVDIHNGLKTLYLTVKSDTNNYESNMIKLDELMNKYKEVTISKQILFSSTLAHIKFFGESQIEWMNEELKFKFWKDKIPNIYKLILILIFGILVLMLIICLVNYYFGGSLC